MQTVIDVSEQEFHSKVVEESKNRLVLVDFWAPWCGPCRTLSPIIEKLAQDYAGQFLLAKVNSDENQALAGEFGVRGIPNVKAFYGGEMIDEFSGAMPEGMVRQFIDRLLPSAAETQRKSAMEAFREGQPEQALASLYQAQALEPENDAIRMDRAEVLLALDRADEATAVLDELKPLSAMDPRAERLRARLTFAGGSDTSEDLTALEARVSSNPDDLGARLALAKRYVADKQFEQALRQLLEIIRIDRGFGEDAGRKTMLAIFELLGSDHPLTSQYRRLLAASLN